jgi:hypothetical protein
MIVVLACRRLEQKTMRKQCRRHKIMAEENDSLQLQGDPLPFDGSFIFPCTEIRRNLIINVIGEAYHTVGISLYLELMH